MSRRRVARGPLPRCRSQSTHPPGTDASVSPVALRAPPSQSPTNSNLKLPAERPDASHRANEEGNGQADGPSTWMVLSSLVCRCVLVFLWFGAWCPSFGVADSVAALDSPFKSPLLWSVPEAAAPDAGPPCRRQLEVRLADELSISWADRGSEEDERRAQPRVDSSSISDPSSSR